MNLMKCNVRHDISFNSSLTGVCDLARKTTTYMVNSNFESKPLYLLPFSYYNIFSLFIYIPSSCASPRFAMLQVFSFKPHCYSSAPSLTIVFAQPIGKRISSTIHHLTLHFLIEHLDHLDIISKNG